MNAASDDGGAGAFTVATAAQSRNNTTCSHVCLRVSFNEVVGEEEVKTGGGSAGWRRRCQLVCARRPRGGTVPPPPPAFPSSSPSLRVFRIRPGLPARLIPTGSIWGPGREPVYTRQRSRQGKRDTSSPRESSPFCVGPSPPAAVVPFLYVSPTPPSFSGPIAGNAKTQLIKISMYTLYSLL